MTELDIFNLVKKGGYNPLDGPLTTNELNRFKTAGLFKQQSDLENQIQDTNNRINSLNLQQVQNKRPPNVLQKIGSAFGQYGMDNRMPTDEFLNLSKNERRKMQIEGLQKFGEMMNLVAAQQSGSPQRIAQAQNTIAQRKAIADAEREEAEKKAKQEQLLASMNPEQRRIYETYGAQAAYDYEFNKPERKIIEGADGFKYYLDGSRVLPNIGIKKDKGDVFKAENDLRDEHQKLSGTFIDVRDAYGRILSNAEKQTAASDLSLIFNYMKMLDPGSVVREGEFANAQNSAGVPDRIRSRYNNVLKGERLAENTRKDFIETAQRLYQTQLSGQTLLDKNYENLSKTYGLNPDNVVLDFTKEIANKEFGYNLSIMSNDQLATLDEKNYNEDQIELIKKELEKRLK